MNTLKVTQKGFTLIELMIVVAIIGILAAIALPNYSEYVMRAKATEATSTLAQLKSRMEQYFQDNKTYLDVVGPPALTAPCTPAAGTSQSFTFACSIQTATTFEIIATPVAGQGVDNFSFTINERNDKTSTFDGTGGGTCWLTRRGGTC